MKYYLFDKMSFMILRYFFILTLASCTVTAYYSQTRPTPVPIENSRCLLLGGFLDEVFVYAYQRNDSTWSFTADVKELNQTLNKTAHLIMDPYLFPNYPYELAADQYAKFINDLPLQTVWFWPARGSKYTCDYMTNFMKSLQRKINNTLGVIG